MIAQCKGIAVPGLAFDRHDIGMPREYNALFVLRADNGMKIGFVLVGIVDQVAKRRRIPADNPAPQWMELEVGLYAGCIRSRSLLTQRILLCWRGLFWTWSRYACFLFGVTRCCSVGPPGCRERLEVFLPVSAGDSAAAHRRRNIECPLDAILQVFVQRVKAETGNALVRRGYPEEGAEDQLLSAAVEARLNGHPVACPADAGTG